MPDWSRYATRVQPFGLATQFESLTSSRRPLILFSLVTSVYATPYVQSQLVNGSDYLTRLAPVTRIKQSGWKGFTLRFSVEAFGKRAVAG